MAVSLPSISPEVFHRALERALPFELERSVSDRMWAHYEELRRWSPRLSLIGRGTVDEMLTRHYAESLLALPLVGDARRLVDLGSGAGFPGMMLALARANIETWLVESRRRKAVFLRRAAARASLSCTILNARVGASLPAGFPSEVDLVTVRALRLDEAQWLAIESRMARAGRVLRWIGPNSPPPPERFIVGRKVLIAGSDRIVQELTRPGREESPS